MIGYLSGQVIHVDTGNATVLCGQIGYIVYPVGCTVELKDNVSLWIHDLVREDRRDLYAFEDLETKLFFEKLIGIDGVGHKLAQKVLNSTNASTLRQHILEGNVAFLTSLSGIGKKTAQKIILEMKGVLVEEDGGHPSVSQDVIDGLKALGYSMQDIKPHLESLPDDVEQALKEVLRRFAKTSGM